MACSMAWKFLWQGAVHTVGLTAEAGDWRGAGLFMQVYAAPNYLPGSWRAWLPKGACTFQAQPDDLLHWRAPQDAGRALMLSVAWARARILRPFRAV